VRVFVHVRFGRLGLADQLDAVHRDCAYVCTRLLIGAVAIVDRQAEGAHHRRG
jgi:hypothetical protein